MPSPLVHSLAGLAIGRFSQPAATRRERLWLWGALVFSANAPDLDFIPGILIGDPGRFHHGAAHSLFAAAMLGVGAAILAQRAGWSSPRRFGLLVGLAFTVHLLLDMLSTDNGIRHGVPLLWPLYDEGLSFPFAIFLDIKRDTLVTSFVHSLLLRENIDSMVREVVVIGIALVTVYVVKWTLPGSWHSRKTPRLG